MFQTFAPRQGIRYYVVGVDGSKKLVFQGDPGERGGNAFWASDGRTLYFTVSNRPNGVTYEGTVYSWLQATDIATGATSRVLEWDGSGDLWLVDLRGDMALLHTGDGLVIDDLTAAPSRQHTPTIAGAQLGSSGLISPDERHIVTTDGEGTDTRIAVRDRSGTLVGAPQDGSGFPYLLGWSPDGSTFLWGASASLHRTAVTSLQTQNLGAYHSAAYAPDGSVVYDVDNHIFVAAPDAASGRAVVAAGALPQVTAAGRITYVSDTNRVCQADLDGTHITALAIATGDANVVLEVPPAGSSVLVIAQQRSDDGMPPYEP